MNENNTLAIFTKPIHVEKLVNFMNQYTDLNYLISTRKEELRAFDFEVGVSYCFPYIVDVNYSKSGKRIWYNYHPAPLPEYPGLDNYSLPIRDKIKEFGVSLHVMTERVDSGPILRVKKFPLESLPVNTNELGTISHYYLFQLFKETVATLQNKPKNKEELEKLLGWGK